MPKLICTYTRFVEILTEFGFTLHRHDGSSHQRWRGTIGGNVRFVDISPHGRDREIPTGTLKAMIRQSGLDQKLFRK